MVRKQQLQQHEDTGAHRLALARQGDDADCPAIVKGRVVPVLNLIIKNEIKVFLGELSKPSSSWVISEVPAAKIFKKVIRNTSGGNHGAQDGYFDARLQMQFCLGSRVVNM